MKLYMCQWMKVEKNGKGKMNKTNFKIKGGMNKEVPTHCPHFCSNTPFVQTLLQVHQ